jgi:hypothetical protein
MSKHLALIIADACMQAGVKTTMPYAVVVDAGFDPQMCGRCGDVVLLTVEAMRHPDHMRSAHTRVFDAA